MASNRSTANPNEAMPEMAERERSTSNDSFRRALDFLELDAPMSKRQRTSTNDSTISEISATPPSGPALGDRVSSGLILSDFFGPPGMTETERGRSTSNDSFRQSMFNIIRRELDNSGPVGASRITSSDFVANYFGSETQPQPQPQPHTQPQSCSEGGEGQQKEGGTGSRSTPETVSDEAEGSLQYHPNDVLFGRGGLSNNHLGNKRYLAEAEKLKPEYRNVSKKEKTLIRNRLVEIVHGYGGRFLQHNKDQGAWEEVCKKRARRKASQALREDSKTQN